MHIVTKIREKRKEAGLSQTQLARVLHVTHATVSMWETGRNMPSLESIVHCADALGCRVDDLIERRQE